MTSARIEICGMANPHDGGVDGRLAEGVGFEPTIRFPVYTLSKRAPSATRPSLRGRGPQYSRGRSADNPGVWVNCPALVSLPALRSLPAERQRQRFRLWTSAGSPTSIT